MQRIQMPYLKNKTLFLDFFHKSALNFEHFQKNMNSLCISEYRPRKIA